MGICIRFDKMFRPLRISTDANATYWDAKYQGSVVSDVFPQIKINRGVSGELKSVEFSHINKYGVEELKKSKTVSNSKIPISELLSVQQKIEELHSLAENLDVPSDRRQFFREFRLPHPQQVPDAWRISGIFKKKLHILWGFGTSANGDGTFLPKSAVSEKSEIDPNLNWHDNHLRYDVTNLIGNSRISNGSLTTLSYILLFILLAGLIWLVSKYIVPYVSNKENCPDSIKEMIVAPTTVNTNTMGVGFQSIPKTNNVVKYVPSPIHNSNIVVKPVFSFSFGTNRVMNPLPPSMSDTNVTVKTVSLPIHKTNNVLKSVPSPILSSNTVVKPVFSFSFGTNRVMNPLPPLISDTNVTVKAVSLPIHKTNNVVKLVRPLISDTNVVVKPVYPTIRSTNVVSALSCDVHGSTAFMGGRCSLRCKACDSHLERDGKSCPNVCQKNHSPVHMLNGICPSCHNGKGIATCSELSISVVNEEIKDGLYYVSFKAANLVEFPSEYLLTWRINGEKKAEKRCDVLFAPVEGFQPNKIYLIEVEMTYISNGEKIQKKSIPLKWTKQKVKDELIERHIAYVEGEFSDSRGKFYMLRVCSNIAEEFSVENKKWFLKMSDKVIPYEIADRDQKAKAIKIYRDSIPNDGAINVSVDLKVRDGEIKTVSGVFGHRSKVTTISQSFNMSGLDMATSLSSKCGDAIFYCQSRNSRGTAFAISKKDLITNHHVVDASLDNGYVELYNLAIGKCVKARIVKVNEAFDLAWLQVSDVSLPHHLLVTKAMPRVGDNVGCLGYPYSTDKEKMVSSWGTVKMFENGGIIVYDTNTYAGNSGSPLVNGIGEVIGVHYQGYYDQEKEMKRFGYARHISKVFKVFPELKFVLKEVSNE